MGGQALTNPEIIALERQRKMAEMLLRKGMEGQPDSQMVSGYYVPPSWAQRLSPILDQTLGQQGLKDVDEKTAKLAEMLRQKESQDLSKFFELQYGGAPMDAQAGPMPDGGNIPVQLSQPDPRAAFEMGMQSSSPLIRSQMAEMLKPQKLSAEETMTRYNPNTGRNEVVAQGTPKFRPPIQIDTGTAIELRDPTDPSKVLSRIPKSQMPTAGQVVERDDGTFLVDTRTGQARPITGTSGQPLTGGGKPLTEVQGNAVGFAARAIEANRIATNLENAGVRNTGAIRTALGSVAGMTPFIGEELEQGVRSAFNVLPSAVGGTSPEQQQVEQARRDFVSAILRPESGAAIGVQEAKNEEKKYFPQAGDTQEVIAQKQQARLKAIEGLKAKAGPSGTRQINQIINAQLSPQDKEALNWANSNPNDPRSSQIKQRLGR
jgi:hypothetical protein